MRDIMSMALAGMKKAPNSKLATHAFVRSYNKGPALSQLQQIILN